MGHGIGLLEQLKTSGRSEKSGPDWNTIFTVALVAFILIGLSTRLLISVNDGLNSDTVGEGLQAMEMLKHGDYFLSSYYLPSEDTFIFTELLPFQLIPQAITNYNPFALKLMSFTAFALAVAVLSYVIFLVSGEATCALLFAALAANISPMGYVSFAIPTSHTATMVFTGAMFALLLYIGIKDKNALDKMKKRSKKTQASPGIAPVYLAGLAALVAITVLSDTIVLTWLIIPYILAYAIFYRGKSKALNAAVICMAAVAVLCYLFKTFFVQSWARQAMVSRDLSGLASINLPLAFKSLALLLNPGLSAVADGLKGFGPLEALSVAVLAVLLVLTARKALADRENRFFYSILIISGVLMFGAFLLTVRVKDLTQARYFSFTALTVFMLVALSYRRDDKVYAALAVALLAISAVYGGLYLADHWGTPNAGEYGLIGFLEEHNLTFGYSTYWNSNIITYLSGEKVAVRAVHFYPDGIESQTLLASIRWYPQVPPDRFFILVDNSSLGALDEFEQNNLIATTKTANSSDTLHYDRFDIYVFDRTKK